MGPSNIVVYKRLGIIALEDLEYGEQFVQCGLFFMVLFGHF